MNLTDCDYCQDSGKPNNNEAFENMMAVRKRVSRKTVRDVTSGKNSNDEDDTIDDDDGDDCFDD